MASNAFGTLFKITTWGESHGLAIGVVIDGCPAGLKIDEEMINQALKRRAPGQSPFTSPRKEKDLAQILSGTFEGKTTGTPISILIWNKDADSSHYEPIKDLLRPGHANFTYLEKYGCFDYRGGGRASGRETATRVAAGAVAKALLDHYGIKVVGYIKQIGSIEATTPTDDPEKLIRYVYESPLFCPDKIAETKMIKLIESAKREGDSLGGIVEFVGWSLPKGLGDPIYEKLEANLSKAMMSLPASKGFEMGEGFKTALMKGSLHNDSFTKNQGSITMATNHAGGTLGGISTGMPLIGRVAFKPTSSLQKEQLTTTTEGKEALFKLPENSRHDPCIALRATPVVEAMATLVIADALLLNRSAQL